MNKAEIFKEIEERIKIFNKYQKQYKIVGENDAVFTTSEEQDIKEMINEGISIPEIVMTIILWNNTISDVFDSKRN